MQSFIHTEGFGLCCSLPAPARSSQSELPGGLVQLQLVGRASSSLSKETDWSKLRQGGARQLQHYGLFLERIWTFREATRGNSPAGRDADAADLRVPSVCLTCKTSYTQRHLNLLFINISKQHCVFRHFKSLKIRNMHLSTFTCPWALYHSGCFQLVFAWLEFEVAQRRISHSIT